ncbi:hypothetical protein ACJJTC_004081 [Scirpophaga incertulas]
MEGFHNFNDVFLSYYFVIGSLFLSYLIYKIITTLFSDNMFKPINIECRHSWRSIQCNKSIPYNIHCTICGKLMLPLVGLFCECCALSACKKCQRLADKKFKCKVITWPASKPFYHHWVKVICVIIIVFSFVVGVVLSSTSDQYDNGLNKYFCSWCQKSYICSQMLLNTTEKCNFIKYRDIIIPPHCVCIENGTISAIKPLHDEDWEPLIILANSKSGSNRCDEVLSLFRGLLNPIQVLDISTTAPHRIVRWLPSRCRLLAVGGDGTVAWILNTLFTAPHVKASVAILPMGTGNDLSRVLGWGSGNNSHLDPHAIINSIRNASEQTLDRWKVTIKPSRNRLRRLRPVRVLYVYNYMSIGVDAQVALDFHRARTQFLYRYASRTLNYMAYVLFGAGRALDDGGCDGLEQRLRVRVDGAREPLPLPQLQSLVVLNINSWGAGVDLWGLGNNSNIGEQRINDRKFEVAGISSSFHIAWLQCSMAEPYRIAQAATIEIELDGSCAMQIDGEPWMQGSATIQVEYAGQCHMLSSNRRAN